MRLQLIVTSPSSCASVSAAGVDCGRFVDQIISVTNPKHVECLEGLTGTTTNV